MPLTKQYLTYQSLSSFGLVAGRQGEALLWPQRERVYVISPCLESIVIWDPRTSLKVRRLSCDSEVSALCLSPDSARLVVGCEDGKVHLFDLGEHKLSLTLSGHKSCVTCLVFSEDGTRVVSGSKDTHVIVWDLISEAGLYRLKGHKGQITDCKIVPGSSIIITSSKDGLVKVWDLDTQHCFQTLAQHRTEVWSIAVLDDTLVTGSNKLSSFSVSPAEDGDKVPLSVVDGGTLKTSSHERVVQIKAVDGHLVVLYADSTIELFKILTQEEVEKKEKKRARKAAKKGVDIKKTPDRVKSLCSMTSKAKARSVDILSHCGELWVLVVLQTNSIELYLLRERDLQLAHSISSPGHRSDVRTICFSSDDSQILTASAEGMKVWNTDSLRCVCTLTSGYALCSTFVPGNHHAILGTKAGSLQVFDLSASSLLVDMTTAHCGPVWSVILSPDKKGVVTGSADQTIKFWDFELSGQALSLSHARTLQMSEDVLCVRYSPDGRLLAVAVIDCTVKVFFSDSLKFFLSMYGHKLPVLCMDISSDSTLLATCSADKNIRIWGLDFGDCHKSLFAHDSSIMAVQFFPNTHQLVSASKDRLLKRWDADNFEHIQTLPGHCGEVWCLAVSNSGALVVSGSHDHSLRVWERTQEPLVLSEQREMEREKLMDEFSAADLQERVVPGEREGEASLPTPANTIITTTDRVLEALSLWEGERERWREHERDCKEQGKQLPSPKPHPILVAMGNIKAERYALDVLKSVRSSELEDSLLVLPFHQATILLELADTWLQSGWEVELSSRCLFFLLRVHHNQLVGTLSLLPLMSRLRSHIPTSISQYKDVFGLNLAGLHYLQDQLFRKGHDVFGDAPDLIKKKPRHV